VLNSTLIVSAQSTQAIAVGAIALFLPLIRTDLGITFAQSGALSAATTLTYALMQIPSGVLTDRFNPKVLFAVGILGSNALAILFATTYPFPLLVVIQAVAGVCRALMFVPGMLLITRHFSEARRATAMGLFVAGGFSSNILLNLVGPFLVGPLGWRGLMLVSSVLGLIVLALFWFLGDQPPTKRPHELAQSARWVWREPAWWLLGGIQFARLAVVTGFTFWLASYLIVERGFSLAQAGLLVALSSAITAPSNIGGGILSDRLGRPLLVIGTSLAALAVLLAIVGHLDNAVLLVIVVAVIAIFIQFYFGPIFAVPRTLFGPGVAGLSSGFGNFCANVGGFVSVLVLGVLKDSTGSFTGGFLVLAAIAGLAFVAVVVLSRTTRRHPLDGDSRG
jgi:ACS family D-galactonate transporter-like MFS transporter